PRISRPGFLEQDDVGVKALQLARDLAVASMPCASHPRRQTPNVVSHQFKVTTIAGVYWTCRHGLWGDEQRGRPLAGTSAGLKGQNQDCQCNRQGCQLVEKLGAQLM